MRIAAHSRLNESTTWWLDVDGLWVEFASWHEANAWRRRIRQLRKARRRG